MILKSIIFIHILAATIWTGGHLILSIGILPKAMRNRDFRIIEQFESRFEPIGLPALLILILTGTYITTVYTPDIFMFNWQDHFTRHILLKYGLLIITLILAIHARFYLIPKKALRPLSVHIILVTIIAILFVLLGFSARSGGIL
ncbi:CopD family protein [Lentiprolixibacter aurantiacus]|uniref:CopD family protein n=1 Tax=Lentiprolixibacter aurantiacus TaxID=2993939 RepID=A0AAE3SMJ4_9FLAO|nr:CopD family protein [Lentiprolixibacter aurantiacus]MCX2718767.1 CopD family protein [Lentiprolixibacter aurantiacus]